MPRYFIEVAYKGTAYSGFQVQENANSIQAEVEKALTIFFRKDFSLTGSSRTDAGVHALQNFFHFDADTELEDAAYHLNAILPAGIAVRRLFRVPDQLHCRFDALSREYCYYIYQHKDPFAADRAFFYPYKIDLAQLNAAAAIVKEYSDFTSFSKRNTQVKTYECRIEESEWIVQPNGMYYHVRANRFLRGMVKGLVGTMLQVGRGKWSLDDFHAVIRAKDATRADFAVPSQGLFLVQVEFAPLPGVFGK
ncbi:MAG: tRNA pseudouridine(38-40) synthase TruA [Ferruginibacter sp.]